MEKTKKNTLLLIAFVLGVLYMLYSAYYWFGGGATSSVSSDAEALGAGLATALVFPHLLLTLLAVIFNGLGFFTSKPAFALTAGILYAVAALLFFMYFMFVIIQMILCFVGYAQLHKAKKANAQ